MIHIVRFTCPKCKQVHVLTSWSGSSLNSCITTSSFSCLINKKKNAYARISHISICKDCSTRVQCISGEKGPYTYIIEDFQRIPVYVLRLKTTVPVDVHFYGKAIGLSRLVPPHIDRTRSTTETMLFFEDWVALTEWGDTTVVRFKQMGYIVKRRICRKDVKWGEIDYRLDVSD